MWLPAGGHVDAGEAPAATALREAREELGIAPRFLDPPGPRPLFVTEATTVGTGARHRDVSLWFACRGDEDRVLRPDPRELAAVRWWSVDAVRRADPARFDPHLGRFLAKLLATVGAVWGRGPEPGPGVSR